MQGVGHGGIGAPTQLVGEGSLRKEVSSIAVMNDGKLLMGKRRDSKRWTLPGGHLNEGEHHHDGALRELLEETGIKTDSLEHLGSDDVTTFTGKNYRIHAYKHDGECSPTTKNDPDKEVEKWEWIDVKDGKLPQDIVDNLHSPKNIVLRKLGLLPKDEHTNEAADAIADKLKLLKAKTKEISIPKKELIEEHEHLINVLESPSKEDDKKEAEKQKKELAGYKAKSIKEKPGLLKSLTQKEDEEASPLMNRIEDKYFVPRIYLNKLTLRLKEKLHDGDIDTFVRYNLNQTIYLDNKDMDCFRSNMENIKPRFKVRIRRYAPNGEKWEDVAYAEMKIKTDGELTKKLRIRIPEEIIRSLVDGVEVSYSEKLMDLNRDISKEELIRRIVELNSLIQKYGLRKQMLVVYERRAYSDKDIRVTVDETIRCKALNPIPEQVKKDLEGEWKKFSKPLKKYTQGDYLVVEVKHTENVPGWIKELLEECEAQQVKFSKYCASVYSCLFKSDLKKTANGGFEMELLEKGEPLSKPYASEAQRRWAHTETGKKALGGEEAVKEWDQASKGKKLPEYAKIQFSEKIDQLKKIKSALEQKVSQPKEKAHEVSDKIQALKYKLSRDTAQGKKLEAIGAKHEAYRQLKAKNPKVDWDAAFTAKSELEKQVLFMNDKPKSETYTHLDHTFHEIEHSKTPAGHKAYRLTNPEGKQDIVFAKNPKEVGHLLNQEAQKKIYEKMVNLRTKIQKKDRCWEGYEPTPGKKPYEKGSCKPIKKSAEKATPKFRLLVAHRPYACVDCGHVKDIQTNHTDDVSDVCPECSWKPSEGKTGHKIPELGNQTFRRFEYVGDGSDIKENPHFKKEDKPFHGYSKEKHSRTGGLNAKYREKYNREHGSNLKAPVTEKNPTGKKAARKKSFCARMSGVKGPTSKEGKLTPKGAALKRWRCSKNDKE